MTTSTFRVLEKIAKFLKNATLIILSGNSAFEISSRTPWSRSWKKKQNSCCWHNKSIRLFIVSPQQNLKSIRKIVILRRVNATFGAKSKQTVNGCSFWQLSCTKKTTKKWGPFWRSRRRRSTTSPSRGPAFDMVLARCKDGVWKWRTHTRPSLASQILATTSRGLQFSTVMPDHASHTTAPTTSWIASVAATSSGTASKRSQSCPRKSSWKKSRRQYWRDSLNSMKNWGILYFGT